MGAKHALRGFAVLNAANNLQMPFSMAEAMRLFPFVGAENFCDFPIAFQAMRPQNFTLRRWQKNAIPKATTMTYTFLITV